MERNNKNVFEQRIQNNMVNISSLKSKIQQDLLFNNDAFKRLEKNKIDENEELGEPELDLQEPKKSSKKGLIIGLILLTLLGVLATGGYFWYNGYTKYQTNFFDKTYINHVNLKDLSVEKSEQLLEQQTTSKNLTLTLPDKTKKIISYKSLGANYSYNQELKRIKETQNPMLWFMSKEEDYDIVPVVTFNHVVAKATLESQLTNHIPQVDFAQAVSFDTLKGEFKINDNVNTMNFSKTAVVENVLSQLEQQKSEIDLTKLGHAESKLTKLVDDANTSLKSSIKIKFGDKVEIIDRKSFVQWISTTKDGIDVDLNALGAYISNLAQNYAHDEKQKHITYDTRLLGDQIAEEIKKGQTKEFSAKELKVDIVKNDLTPDKKYPFCAAHKDGTFVEVNKSTQTLCAYINGSVKYGANVVTGDHSKGRDTPNGTWKIWNKSMNTVLKGSTVGSGADYNYNIPVKYWMPIDNTGVGLHSIDPDEVTGYHGRVNWSPSAYLNGGGSHGCVNMHTNDAQWIYENMPLNTKVVVF